MNAAGSAHVETKLEVVKKEANISPPGCLLTLWLSTFHWLFMCIYMFWIVLICFCGSLYKWNLHCKENNNSWGPMPHGDVAQPGCHGSSCADMTGHVRCFWFLSSRGGEDTAFWDKATKYLFLWGVSSLGPLKLELGFGVLGLENIIRLPQQVTLLHVCFFDPYLVLL